MDKKHPPKPVGTVQLCGCYIENDEQAKNGGRIIKGEHCPGGKLCAFNQPFSLDKLAACLHNDSVDFMDSVERSCAEMGCPLTPEQLAVVRTEFVFAASHVAGSIAASAQFVDMTPVAKITNSDFDDAVGRMTMRLRLLHEEDRLNSRNKTKLN